MNNEAYICQQAFGIVHTLYTKLGILALSNIKQIMYSLSWCGMHEMNIIVWLSPSPWFVQFVRTSSSEFITNTAKITTILAISNKKMKANPMLKS